MDELERIREVARSLISQGHPGLAHTLFEIAAKLDPIVTRTDQEHLTELKRLRAIVQHALPHQSNQEVTRWLSAGLHGAGPVYQNVNGRRIDLPPS